MHEICFHDRVDLWKRTAQFEKKNPAVVQI